MRKFVVNVNGTSYEVEVEELDAAASSKRPAQEPKMATATASSNAGGTKITSPMPGTILDVKVSNGQRVKNGQLVMILEAMKMENEIFATKDGVVTSVNVTKGASVNAGDVLMTIG